jgi:hypothetical protein
MKDNLGVLYVVRCIHARWSGYLRLFIDGTFEQVGTSSRGRWHMNNGLLTLTWGQNEEEKFRQIAGEFIHASIQVPGSPQAEERRRSLTMRIEGKIEAHSDSAAWLRKDSTGPRLGIIVPYRARQEHLGKLLPHLISFFRRDLRNSHINPLIVIAEQADEGRFNRGWCRNGGFLAVEKHCDYVCFHDVDYLPVWADYSYSVFPTRIVWWGMNFRPVRVASDNKLWVTNSRNNFGAVIVMDRGQFLAANGYSNKYIGWGYEDDDLKARLESQGFATASRDGTFIPLDHDHEGFTTSGEKNQDWLDNEKLFVTLRRQYQESRSIPEGLSTMSLGHVEVAFERHSGLDQSESLVICRLRIQQA